MNNKETASNNEANVEDAGTAKGKIHWWTGYRSGSASSQSAPSNTKSLGTLNNKETASNNEANVEDAGTAKGKIHWWTGYRSGSASSQSAPSNTKSQNTAGSNTYLPMAALCSAVNTV